MLPSALAALLLLVYTQALRNALMPLHKKSLQLVLVGCVSIASPSSSQQQNQRNRSMLLQARRVAQQADEQTLSDGREALPYHVFVIPKETSKITIEKRKMRELGTFFLEASTACGDLLELGPTLGTFKVKRVRFGYKFSGGKFKVTRKSVDVNQVDSPWAADLPDGAFGISTEGILQ